MSERHGARFSPPIGKAATDTVEVARNLRSSELPVHGAFMMQVGRNLTDPLDGFLRGKRFLILDRDKKFAT